MSIAKYGVLRHQPYANRSEHLNIGIVAFLDDGRVRAHMGGNLRKLKAFDPSASLETVRDWETSLPAQVTGMSQTEAHRYLMHFGAWRLSETLGQFFFDSEERYLSQVKLVLDSLVEPSHPRRVERPPKSRLFIDLKNAFSTHDWLGSRTDDIKNHKIVTRFPISAQDDVYAEFALRNGKLHITETIDFRVATPSAKRQEAQAKAMVFNLATILEENSGVNSYIVTAASNYDEARQSIHLLSRFATVLAWESKVDMDNYMDLMARATGSPMLALPPI